MCRKKTATYFTVAVFFILNGVEYAVIFPTLWLYLHSRFDAQPYMMGITVAAYSFTGFFSGPLIGKWADKSRNTKMILMFANLWEIGGSIMYFLGFSSWFLVGSRLVSGIGSGAGAAVIADISRGTDIEERTPILSRFMACRQFGLLIGPAFNLFLREMHFYIGPFRVDEYTSPGLFLAILWSFLQLQTLFCYHNLEALRDDELLRATASVDYDGTDSFHAEDSLNKYCDRAEASTISSHATHVQYGSINATSSADGIEGSSAPVNVPPTSLSPFPHARTPRTLEESARSDLTFSNSYGVSESFTDSSRVIESAEKLMNTNEEEILKELSNSRADPRSPIRNNSSRPLDNRPVGIPQANGNISTQESSEIVQPKPKLQMYLNEYVREEIVVLLSVLFISFFNQVGLETMLTPLTKLLLGWEELQNSILYSSCAVQLLIVFWLVSFASKRIQDRFIIMFGLLMELAGMVWNLFFIPTAKPNDPTILPYLIVGTVLILVGMPCLATCAVSLYSKVTKREMQGFSHGLRRSITNIAFILGPLWGGGMLGQLQACFAVNTTLLALMLVMAIISFKRLSQPCLTSSLQRHQREVFVQEEEAQALLSN